MILKKLARRMKGREQRPDPDTSEFDDEVASLTDWSPLKGGGANFKTHKLKKVHAQRMEFRSSIGALLFAGLFFVVGVGVLIGAVVGFIRSWPEIEWPVFIFLPIFGLIFGGVGFFLLRSVMIPRVFDLSHGYYCRSFKKPEHSFDPSEIRDHVRITEIHALQLLSEYISGDKSSYYSYELNLVLTDGSRINVVDHGGRTAIERDAETLAQFLGKPLWNRI